MTKASDNLFPKLIVGEAATDGSDFSNPSADYRVLFLGEDGLLHVKDSGGSVTSPYSGGAFYGARVSRTTNQAITTATFTDVLFNATDEVDTNALHDPAGANPERIIIPSGGDGYYDIGFWVSLANSTAGTFRLARILRNGTSISEQSIPFHTNVGVNGQVFAGAVPLVATDYITGSIYQDSSGDLNVTAARLSVSRIGT